MGNDHPGRQSLADTIDLRSLNEPGVGVSNYYLSRLWTRNIRIFPFTGSLCGPTAQVTHGKALWISTASV